MLEKDFFDKPVLTVARELIGKTLVREVDGVSHALMITETEAYDGEQDLACHASKGRTKRTEVLYGKAGIWYVYLIYGMYDMLNIVCGPEDYPSAVLIRGVEGFDGPGKLTKGLRIHRALNTALATKASGLWIEEGIVVPDKDILITPRIGVTYAKEWAEKPYRFVFHPNS